MKPYVSGWFNYNDVENTFPKVNEAMKNVMGAGAFQYKECEFDEAHEEALIKELIERGYVICGDTHQSYNHNCVPLFNDGYLTVSMRTWGGIMAKAMNIIEKSDKYTYMDFYMASVCNIEERLPGEKDV